MEQLELVAERRVVKGKQVKQLRNEGVIPSIVYGHEIGSIPIQIPEKQLRMALAVAGTNRLIALSIQGDKKPTLVLAREIQRDSLNGTFLHVDFQAVVMTEKIRTDMRLNFINQSPAVLDGSGMVLYSLDTIEIECLPTDLISSMDIDLSILAVVDDTIYVKDLTLPSTVTVLSNPDEMIVRVSHVIEIEEEEEEEELEEIGLEEEVPEAGEVEVIRKGKEEETKDKLVGLFFFTASGNRGGASASPDLAPRLTLPKARLTPQLYNITPAKKAS